MWRTVKWLLARGPFGNILADVIFEAPRMKGQAEHSQLQWRLKRRVDTNRVFISLKVVPDYYGASKDATATTSSSRSRMLSVSVRGWTCVSKGTGAQQGPLPWHLRLATLTVPHRGACEYLVAVA